ncbi:MAG: Xaa-Pro peptidase family protein [Pseudomonadota bacterium]
MSASENEFFDERKRLFLNQAGADQPLKSPIADETVMAARRYRLSRLREKVVAADCGAILLYDPINIRYALDVTNMQVWTAHNAMRYALIFAEGPAVMFEFEGCHHLCDGVEAIDELRSSIPWIFMSVGNLVEQRVNQWADEIVDLVNTYARGNRRLLVDKLEPAGLKALESRDLFVIDGQEVTERARSIKSEAEIELMRWTIRVAEAGMARIYENSVPGKTEQELWAELHFENARSGGEWLETRLLTCGSRTNPWYQECGPYECGHGEMISFDTDMIGPYGYCADLSRSWTCGYTRMNAKQAELYLLASDQVHHNLAVIEPGLSFREFNQKSWQIPEKHRPFRYSLAAHGVGMADEWPVIPLHPDFEGQREGEFEPGMVVCVESLMAEPGSESVKLEIQVRVTDDGTERLDQFPLEAI